MKKIIAKILFTTLLACVLCAGEFSGNAEGLPIKTVNGRQCYVYTVKKGDTVFGVSNALGLTRNDIIENNPSATDGLKNGMALYFPVDEFDLSGFDSATNAGNPAPSGDIVFEQYIAKKGDTLFGIAHQFGISTETIVEHNPGSATGVKPGQVLNIPVSGEVNPGFTAPGPDALREVKPGVVMVTPVMESLDSIPADTISEAAEPEEIILPDRTVVIMLPFMLDEETPGKAAISATDFYKGFLIAADTLETLMSHINIIAIDTESNSDLVHTILTTDSRLRDADVIVAPDNVLQLAELAEFGERNGIYVFNSMNAHDSTYLSSAHAIQASIPSGRMIDKAVEACIDANSGFTPVLLVNDNSRNDKKAFVDGLTAAETLRGVTPLNVNFSGSLSLTDITDQLGEPDETTRYLFIPSSGSLSEFNKFSNALERYRAQAVEAGGEVRVFGYPEWTAFRGDSRKALHDIDAIVYARSFNDPASMSSRGVDASFVKWFGHKMSDGVPSQGLLGYDTGCFILKGLARGVFDEDGSFEKADLRGIQSAFFLQRNDENSGPVNDALYIVRFMPGEVIDVEIK